MIEATGAKVLIALALVVSPASLGVASYAGAIDLGLGQAQSSAFGGVVVERFEESFETPITTGSLDLRVERGDVRVIGWEKNAYKVLVLQEAGNATLSDRETEVTFDEDASDGHLELKITAERTGTYTVDQDGLGLQTGESRDLAIVAYVPANAEYELVRGCSGEPSYLSGTFDAVQEVLGEVSETSQEDRTCMAPEERPSTMGRISVNHVSSAPGLNVTTGVEGLTGDELQLRVEYGDVEALDSTFTTGHLLTEHGDLKVGHSRIDTLQASSEHGSIEIDGLVAESVAVETEHGDADLATVDTAELVATTEHGSITSDAVTNAATLASEHGDIELVGSYQDLKAVTEHGSVVAELEVQGSGAWEFGSEHGDIEVHVPARETIGYLATAETEHGDIELGLSDADTTTSEEDHDQKEAEARTHGYDEKPVQVQMDLATEHGDILLTDGTGHAEQDEGEGATSQSSPGDRLGDQLRGPLPS